MSSKIYSTYKNSSHKKSQMSCIPPILLHFLSTEVEFLLRKCAQRTWGGWAALCERRAAAVPPRNPPLLPLRLPGSSGEPTRRVYPLCSLPGASGAAENSNFCYENALMCVGASGRLCASVEAAQRLQYPTPVAPATDLRQWRPYAARIRAAQPAGRSRTWRSC